MKPMIPNRLRRLARCSPSNQRVRTQTTKGFVEMTPSWKSMQRTCDFAILPTMTWMPLRGIHMPTKPTTILRCFIDIKKEELEKLY